MTIVNDKKSNLTIIRQWDKDGKSRIHYLGETPLMITLVDLRTDNTVETKEIKLDRVTHIKI